MKVNVCFIFHLIHLLAYHSLFLLAPSNLDLYTIIYIYF